jgi:glycosyltransferase involved in cell wall biosynthesis
MRAVYNALDVLVSASSGEGFPNAVAEAMACEKPCVVTAVGDSASLVADSGISIPAGKPESLARAILQVLELPETERIQLGKKARRRIAENFSLEKMTRAYSDLYERLM